MPEELKKRLDADTRKRLEAIQAGYEKWTHRTVRILAVLAAATCVLGVVSILLIGSNQDRVDDVEAAQAAIQQSRIDISRTTCEQQNTRHDNTIAQLDALIREIAKDPATSPGRLERIKQSRASTVLLIDALAPSQDCDALIAERFGTQAK